MLTQAAALALVAWADSFAVWALAAVLLGAGTAMVYPTLHTGERQPTPTAATPSPPTTPTTRHS